jgi:drug/metabolite transporter (DMT)-like permease
MTYGRGIALVLVAATLWSLTGLAIRLIGDAGTWAILFWRSAGMIPVLALWVVATAGGRPLARVRQVGIAGVVGGCGLVLAFFGAIYSFENTTIANAVFLFAAAPLLTALLGRIILGEDVRRGTWVAIAVAAVGVLLMVREGLSTGALIGNLAALGSALGFAAFTVTLRWGRLDDMMPAVVLGGAFSMIAAGAVSVAAGEPLAVAPRDVAIALTIGAALLGAGMILYTLGSRAVPAAELALLSMVEVLLAPVWVWLVLGETATAGAWAGGTIILVAIAFNALTGIRRKPVAPPLP